MKTNKSISKRIKVTKTGKLIARKPGFNHFNAKQSRSKQLEGKRGVPFEMDNKLKSRLLPYS
jgi:ribosomal protein L35